MLTTDAHAANTSAAHELSSASSEKKGVTSLRVKPSVRFGVKLDVKLDVNPGVTLGGKRIGDASADRVHVIGKCKPGFFITADSLITDDIVLHTDRHPTASLHRHAAWRCDFSGARGQAIHTHAYQYIVESVDLDEAEIFDAHNDVPSIRAKDAPLVFEDDDRLRFKIGTRVADRTLLKSLIVRRSASHA